MKLSSWATLRSTAGAIRSRRLDHYLGELSQQTDRHRTIIEVTELRERLAGRQVK